MAIKFNLLKKRNTIQHGMRNTIHATEYNLDKKKFYIIQVREKHG